VVSVASAIVATPAAVAPTNDLDMDELIDALVDNDLDD
jgi:hypothetical protein